MKIAVFTLLILAPVHSWWWSHGHKNNEFYDLMEQLLQLMSSFQSNSDPFSLNEYQSNMSTKALRYELKLGSMILSGVSSFHYTFTGPLSEGGNGIYNFRLDMGYEHLKFITDYSLNLDLLTMLPLHGNGQAGLLFKELNISMTVNLGKNSDDMMTVNIDPDFALDNIVASITGFLDTEEQSDLLSSLISDLGAKYLMEYKEKILQIIKPLINVEINQLLQSKQVKIDDVIFIIKTILDIIHGNGGIPGI